MLKQLLMKSLLVAAGLFVGASAWGQVTTIYERGAGTSWSDADLTQWVAGGVYDDSKVTTSISGGLVMTSVAKAQTNYSFTKSVSTQDDTKLVLTATWTPTCYGAGNYAYLQFGDIILKASRSDWTSSITANGTPTALTATDNASLTGEWNITLIINQKTHRLSYSITHSKGTDAATIPVAIDADYSSIIAGVHGSEKIWNWDYSQTLSVVSLTEEDITGANYTVHFKDNLGATVKDDEVRIGDVGATVNASDDDKNDFVSGEFKYVYINDGGGAEVLGDGSAEFTITYNKIAKYNYTVRALDSSSKVLNASLLSGYVWAGDNAYIAYPQFVLSGSTLYEVAKEYAISGDWYHATITPDRDDYVFDLPYNTTISDVEFYSEAENLAGFNANDANVNINGRSSNGKVARSGAWKSLTTLGPGKYEIYARAFSDGVSTRNMTVKAGGDQVFYWEFPNNNNGLNHSDEFELSNTTAISIIVNGTKTAGLDWIYIKKTGDYTISVPCTTGFATYANHDYALNFDGITGLTAYTATLNGAKDAIVFTPATQVPAGTGLLLKGETKDVPVIASAADIDGNLLYAPTSAITSNSLVFDDGTYYNYILSNKGGKIGFYQANNSNVAVGKAYLRVEKAVLAREFSFIGFDGEDETTGINDVNRETTTNNRFFDLQGRNVAAPTKGLYIMNGKKVIVK